ncbi:hypothetical protein N5923_12950 [Erwiniaceae bacterium BAC15a-03b]|uniref:Uncharacterized protein n=1 Tax=Winslowiella arboricola TaxID=2978220 RepID=A0A9J6PWL6_9GAMM|nr:hypothetical protein [Winslowiella arboricola]MCU5773702.1 hypothetical protein [Winslowiella arboricola]MCU5778399.1 hypothetical protein [Winslowiella arboricola]
MTAKQRRARTMNFDLVSPGNRIEHDIRINELPVKNGQQYVIVEIPEFANAEVFQIALQSAVNTLAAINFRKQEERKTTPQRNAVQNNAETFTDRNTQRLNQLKESILQDGHCYQRGKSVSGLALIRQ